MKRPLGFTLIELLVVIAISAILLVLTLPAVSSLVESNNITRAGQMLNDQIALARQLASTRGQSVQVRLYKPDGTRVTALQVMGGTGFSNALTKVAVFPENMALNAGLSPLLGAISANTTNSGPLSVAGKANVDATFFVIRATGAIEPSLGSNNYITVANTRKDPPDNYATIQLDPESAQVTLYRP